MANKAAKTQARTNTATLNKTHMVTGVLHGLFILYRLLFRHGSWKKYILLSAPALLLEYYLERLGRPKLHPNGELRSPGEDMAAAGVTEYCWDIVHVTWIVLVLVGIFGEWAWWIGMIVPSYAAFLAYTTYTDMKRGGGLPGMPAPPPTESQTAPEQATSKRQKKADKRGGQKTVYR